MTNKKQAPAYPAKVRQKWYFLAEKVGKTVDEVCGLYFISRKTYYKWRTHDLGSREHVSRKEHPETKIKGEVKIFISEEKLRINYGPKKMKLLIKRRFGISISTTAIYKFYKKKGMIRRPQKRLPWYQPLKNHVIPNFPGDVVQVDTKYVWLEYKTIMVLKIEECSISTSANGALPITLFPNLLPTGMEQLRELMELLTKN